MPSKPKSAKSEIQPVAAHHIHALLQTMRAIHQHEDQFCTLMHAIERSGKLNAAENRELHKLLDQMPGPAFQHDLEALRETLLPLPEPKSSKPADTASNGPTRSSHAH